MPPLPPHGDARLAGFVMTFRRPDSLAAGLPRILGQSHPPEHLLVVDNAADAATREVAERFAPQGVEYLAMESNLGPAGAAAHALARLLDGPWEWLYWGGDDGPPGAADTFERLLTTARREDGRGAAGIGAVAVSGLHWDWNRGAARRIGDDELGGPLEVDVIPGGGVLLVHRRAVETVGLPRPELFWGLEDIEYGLRLRRAGFTLLVDGALLREERAAADRLGHQVRRSAVPRIARHRVARHYYTTRNYVFLMRRVFDRPDLARREMARAAVRSAAAWLRGPRFGAAFSECQWSAVRDALRGRMGFTRPLPVAPRHAPDPIPPEPAAEPSDPVAG